MHLTLSHDINRALVTAIELGSVHGQNSIAIDVRSAGRAASSIVNTPGLNGPLEALIYNNDPREVIQHRKTLRPSPTPDMHLGPLEPAWGSA